MVLRAIPLWSEALGLSGRADAVELEGDHVRPVEYKSGVPHGRTADLQVCAQAMCLEEMLAVRIDEASVWYGGLRRRVQVSLTTELRDEVRRAIFQIRGQIVSGQLPDAPNDERCAECQLEPHCLPSLTSAPVRVGRYLTTEVFGCGT